MTRWLTALLAVLSVTLLAAVAVWMLRDDGVTITQGEPVVLSASELSGFAEEAGHPIYWLGEREGDDYELTETAERRIYVRYLTGDAQAGDKRADFITVATYPARNGVAELRKAAAENPKARLARTDDGAVLLIDPSSPDNAHLAYPGADLQIEVYSPAPGQALRLASRGAVQPVG